MDASEIREQKRQERRDKSKVNGALWLYIVIAAVFLIATPVIGRNLPHWVGFDHRHPLMPICTWGCTILGFLALALYIRPYVISTETRSKPSIGLIILSVPVLILNGLFLFGALHKFHGLF